MENILFHLNELKARLDPLSVHGRAKKKSWMQNLIEIVSFEHSRTVEIPIDTEIVGVDKVRVVY